MKMTRYSEPQILPILRQAEGGMPVAHPWPDYLSGMLMSWAAERGVTIRHVSSLGNLSREPTLSATTEQSDMNGRANTS